MGICIYKAESRRDPGNLELGFRVPKLNFVTPPQSVASLQGCRTKSDKIVAQIVGIDSERPTCLRQQSWMVQILAKTVYRFAAGKPISDC